MRYRFARVAVFAGLLVVAIAATAATRYVSDELSVNMRVGPSTDYHIAQILGPGEPVQTLSEDNDWTRIRAAGGATGYVLTRLLSDELAARTRVEALQQQVDKLGSKNAELKRKLSEAADGSNELGDTRRELMANNKALSARLQKIRETSADAIRIGNENEKFREQLLSIRSDNERLRHENAALTSRREGMKIGALILIGGIVVGLLLPLFRRRRKGSWDSL